MGVGSAVDRLQLVYGSFGRDICLSIFFRAVEHLLLRSSFRVSRCQLSCIVLSSLDNALQGLGRNVRLLFRFCDCGRW